MMASTCERSARRWLLAIIAGKRVFFGRSIFLAASSIRIAASSPAERIGTRKNLDNKVPAGR